MNKKQQSIFAFRGKVAAYIKAVVFLTIAFSYLFWSLDAIPDATGPIIGYVDDGLIFLFAAWAIRGAINTILDNRLAFLTGGKKK